SPDVRRSHHPQAAPPAVSPSESLQATASRLFVVVRRIPADAATVRFAGCCSPHRTAVVRRKRELSKSWLPFSSDPSHGSDSSNPTRNHFQPSR
uniref:Uncharacterized protein n=1 Tax=Cucumis melo TaxID=3656 RepID=A0A9I9E3C4_CUCME